MSESATPSATIPASTVWNGRTLRPDIDENGENIHADESGKGWVPLARLRAMAARVKELEAAAASGSKPSDELRGQIRKEVEAELAPRILSARTENALIRAGLASDDEALAEVMMRYERVQADKDGARPDVSTWLAAEVKAGRRWIASVRQEQTTTAEKPAQPTTETNAEAAPATATKTPPRDPNGGVSRPGVQPATRELTDADYQKMSLSEFRQHYAAERTRMGLDPDPIKGVQKVR
jgi:hypothetical protein